MTGLEQLLRRIRCPMLKMAEALWLRAGARFAPSPRFRWLDVVNGAGHDGGEDGGCISAGDGGNRVRGIDLRDG
jgi:hypothetical protein